MMLTPLEAARLCGTRAKFSRPEFAAVWALYWLNNARFPVRARAALEQKFRQPSFGNSAGPLIMGPNGNREASWLEQLETLFDRSSDALPIDPALTPLLACSPLRPAIGDAWSWERLHLFNVLSQNPLGRLGLVLFDFASDKIDATRTLDDIAALMRQHPGLRIQCEGHARPQSPPEYGMALSQARAARVRSELLLRCRDTAAWSTEDRTEGVRAGGYSESDDFDAVAEFYQQRQVGEKVVAVGKWRVLGLGYMPPPDRSDGQCATIEVGCFVETRSH